MAYYTALLNYGASPAVENQESTSDLDAAKRRYDALRTHVQLKHLVEGSTVPMGAYLGTSAPSTPSTKSWISAGSSFNLKLLNPSGTAVYDENPATLQEYEARARSLQAQADLNNAGFGESPPGPGWRLVGTAPNAHPCNQYDLVAL